LIFIHVAGNTVQVLTLKKWYLLLGELFWTRW